jgi:endo-1,4-beta-D-glucanase Y
MGGAYGESGNNVMRAHLNGRFVQTATTRQNTNTNVHCFGMRDNSQYPAASRFTEIVMWTNWTITDINKTEGYLAWAWGGLPRFRIIDTHPFRQRPPLEGD